MKSINTPLNEKEYEKAREFLDNEKPDVVILNAKVGMEFAKISEFPMLKKQYRGYVEIFDKFSKHLRKNFDVYFIYTPVIMKEWRRKVRKEYDKLTLLQKIKLNIVSIPDIIPFLKCLCKMLFYTVLRNKKKMESSVEELFEHFEKGKFRMGFMNTIGKVFSIESKLLKQEVKKIVNKNKGKKIIYFGADKDVNGPGFEHHINLK